MAKAGTAHVFAWKGETLPEYWYYTEQMMTALCADGCDSLVVDDGDVTLHRQCKEYEDNYAEVDRHWIQRARLT